MEPGRYQSKKEKKGTTKTTTRVGASVTKQKKNKKKNKVMAMPACGENGNQLPIPGMSVLNIT